MIFDGGIVRLQLLTIPQSACSADSPLYTRGPLDGASKVPTPTIGNVANLHVIARRANARRGNLLVESTESLSFPPGKPCGGSKQPPYNICSAFSENIAQKGSFILSKLRTIPTSAERFTQLSLLALWSFDHNIKSTDLKCGRKEKKLRYFSYFV